VVGAEETLETANMMFWRLPSLLPLVLATLPEVQDCVGKKGSNENDCEWRGILAGTELAWAELVTALPPAVGLGSGVGALVAARLRRA